FGGPLDDADLRLTHYLDVLNAELAKYPDRFPAIDVADQPLRSEMIDGKTNVTTNIGASAAAGVCRR
ncbi:MAG: hypothetical protein MJA84_02940, partial [Firmicutes bacterium]|nr:hypothetical protein [Bacillota bacterium]